MNKKVIAVVTAFAMLTGTFSTVFASPGSEADSKVQQKTYSDISGHWASKAIDKWSGLGVISGNQRLFRPDASITRGEMACILDNIMDYQVSAKNTFSDLKDGRFYTNSVLKVNAAGIMNGDGASKLRPTDKITREEAAVMLAKAFAVSNGDTLGTKFGDAGEISSWAKAALSGMESKGYIKGTDGKCNPKANITRAETVAIINNIVKAYYTKAGTYTDNVEGTAVVKVSDVVLKGTVISENLIIAEGVGKGDATLDSVNVKGNTVVRGGGENSVHIEGTSNIQNIKIEKNGEKLRIVVADGSTVKNMEVVDGEEIIITGSVGTVEISASDVNVQATGANISNATVSGSNSSITLDKGSKIGALSVGEKADNTAIRTEKGASVDKITAAAKTAVSGKGTVKEVNLNEGAKDSNITTPDTQIKAAAGVTGVTGAGKKVIEAGSSVANNSKGDGIIEAVAVPAPVTPMPSVGGSSGGNTGGSTDDSNKVILGVKSVKALNSKILEVSLDKDVTAAYAQNLHFEVKAVTGPAIDVESINIAPWEKSSVIVALKKDTSDNTNYELTAGDKKYAFSGRTVDTVKPFVISVAATDANEVTITFNEAVKINALKVAISEAYGTKASVAVNSIKYDGSNKVVMSVGDMRDFTLYKCILTDVLDMADNQLENNRLETTFVGRAVQKNVINKDAQARVNSSKEIVVKFDGDVAPANLILANFTVAEKYGSKTKLKIAEVRFAEVGDIGIDGKIITSATDAKNCVVIRLEEDLKEATLYEVKLSYIIVHGEKPKSETIEQYTTSFVGKDPQKTIINKNAQANANSIKEVVVKFGGDIAPENLMPANLTVAEMYGLKTKLKIAEVRFAKVGDKGTDGKIITSETDAKNCAVIKLLEDLKEATLYEVKLRYTIAIQETPKSETIEQYAARFVGTINPGQPFTLKNSNVVASSNTTFSIYSDQSLDEVSAKNLENYSLEEANGTKTLLQIKGVVCEGKKLTFTTDSMKSVNYKLTITNLKDVYGNTINTADSANIVTVRGISAAEEAMLITKIESISRTLPAGSTAAFDPFTQIVVDFDKNVGVNATDASLYTFSFFYGSQVFSNPSKVDRVDGVGNEDKVILTIGKTNEATLYMLTVNGLLNSEGIVASDLTATFIGAGNNYTLPKMQAILAIDKQTIKIYFDRNVDSPDIKGTTKIWTENGLNAEVFKIKYAGQADTEYRNFPSNKAWKDPDKGNVLIVRTNVENKFKYSSSLGGQFVLDGTGALLDADNDNLIFISNDSDIVLPQISTVIAKDARNLIVNFDQAVVINGNANEVFTVGTYETADTIGNTEVAVGTGRPIKIDEKTYIIQLNGFLTNSTYYLRVPDLQDIKDKSGYFCLKSKNEWNSYSAVQFGGTSTYAYGSIADVSVMMADKNTIEVYYPERMDKATVTNVANYRIYKDTYGYMPSDGISVPTAVAYNADTKVATLYLSGGTISGSSSYLYGLGISENIKNEVGTKNIKSDRAMTVLGNGLTVAFGSSTSDDAKPQIKNVSVALDDNTKITVEFDEAISTAKIAEIISSGFADKDNQIVINDAQWGVVTTSSAIDLFKITDTTTNAAISIVSIKKISNTKFEIVTATPINAVNSYQLVIGDTKSIYNLGGTQVETASDRIQKFVFTAIK